MSSVLLMRNSRKRRYTWGSAVGIFLLAATPRLAVVWSGLVPLAPDTTTYVIPAKNLAAGRGYSYDSGEPYSYRAPTYPLFLAAVFIVAGEQVRPVQVTQALLAAVGIAALALWMMGRYGAGPGLGTGILLALDPILIPVPAFVLTEAMGMLLVVALVINLSLGLATGQRPCLYLAGLLGGAAALNTPVTLLLVPWLLLTAWIMRSPRRPDWRGCVVTCSITALCIGAWATRNFIVQGEVILVHDRGFGEWVWRTTEYHFDWVPDSYDPAVADLERKFTALIAGHKPGQQHRVLLRAAWQNFTDDPFRVLKRVAKADFWALIESPGSHLRGQLRPFRWLTFAFHQLQLLGLVVALWALWRTGELRTWGLWVSTMVYFPLFLSLMYPIPRYYVPLWPLVDTLIVVGLTLLSPRNTSSGAVQGVAARSPEPI